MTDPDSNRPATGISPHAWARFRTLMRWMVLAAIVAIGVAFLYLWLSDVTVTVHMLIATAAGVGLSVLLGTGLMGLVFLSSGSGHDADAGRRHD